MPKPVRNNTGVPPVPDVRAAEPAEGKWVVLGLDRAQIRLTNPSRRDSRVYQDMGLASGGIPAQPLAESP